MPNTPTISLNALASLTGSDVLFFNPTGQCERASVHTKNLISALWPDDITTLTRKDLMEICYEFALIDARRDEWIRDITGLNTTPNQGFCELLLAPGKRYFLVKMVDETNKGTTALIQDVTSFIQWREGAVAAGWQNRILLQAIEETRVGMMLFDPTVENAHVLFVNQACCDIFSKSRSAILGANWHEFIPEWKIGRETEMIERIVGDTPRIFAVQVSIRHDLGLVFMADVTDLQDKEEQVRHMQRLDSLGHLAGGVAHDFNNIVSIINGYGQLLAGWAGDDTKAKPATDAILNACKRGSGLTTKLLALARRKKVGGDESCDLNTALLQIESLLRPLIPKNIDLGFSVPPRPVHVRASEDHLHQIIMNLVVNARDAMQEGANGAIDVRCTIEPNIDGDEKLFLRVVDTGVGMPPDVQKRIFEPFFTTKETGRGTGLGLAVTYGLVQQCHGTIDVASEPGAGTTFTITLPIHEIDAPSITQIKTETDGGIPSGLTIMLAEDEDDLREPLKQILEQWGLTVLTAMHGNDALDQQDSHDGPIHLLLSDIQMPGLFGDELAKLWRDIRPETKIILMSGFAKGHDPHAGIANAFLPKPINFDVLKKTVQDVLNAPIMGEQNGG